MDTIKIAEDLKALQAMRDRWLAAPGRTDHLNSALCALGAVCDNLKGELNRLAASAKTAK